MAAGVLAPQPADDVHGLLGRGGELQARVDGRAGVQTQVLGGQPAAEPPGEDLGDQRGGGAARLLAAQPAGHGGLVVAQVEAVLEAELVHPAGESGVGESGFGDERGELSVGDALREVVPSSAVRSPAFGCGPALEQPLWNGANVAGAARAASPRFAAHSSDRVRIG